MNPTHDVSMLAVWLNVLYLLSRYVHIISAMLLVGGILFYEAVVPVAISDLREETQVAIFARARWVFRWIIWTSAALLILTGVYITVRRMPVYIESEFMAMSGPTHERYFSYVPWTLKTGWWWAAHASSAVIAILVALYLGAGDRPPVHPIGWLRMDLMILLIVVFFAVATVQIDQLHQERIAAMQANQGRYTLDPLMGMRHSTTEPTTSPAEER